MEQEHHQWIVNEEEEVKDGALKTRQTLPHGKGNNLITGVEASPSSPVGNGGEHSNGVCLEVTDPDGSSLQKEEELAEIENVGEKSNLFYDEKVDFEAVGLGLVAEFVGEEARNVEAIKGATFSADVLQNKNSVYFDKKQDNEVNGVQNGDAADNEVNGLHGVQNGDAAGSACPTNPGERKFGVQVEISVIQNSLCSKVNNQCMKTVDEKVPSNSELSPSHNSSDLQAAAVVNFHEETNIKEGPNLIKEIDQQMKEYDVEVVLAKQETHDLFCPNCHSCITKRVILKKRKRNIHKIDNKAKREKPDTVVSPQLVNGSVQEANRGDNANVTSDIISQEPPADIDHPEREPEVFTCLSCFSFFIPSGNCFNLFRNFGGASKHETAQNPSSLTAPILQDSSNLPGSNPNWFISRFTSNKGKKVTGQGDTSPEHSRTGPAEQHHSTSITSDMRTSPEIGHPEGPLADAALIKKDDSSSIQSGAKSASNDMKGVQSVGQDSRDFSAKEQLLNGNLRTNEGEKKHASVDTIKTNGVEVMPSKSFSDEMVPEHDSVQVVSAATSETLVKAGETTKDAVLNPFEGVPEFLVPTTLGTPILEKSQKDADDTPEIVENSNSSLRQGAQSPDESLGSAVLASGVASIKQSSEIDTIFPSKKVDFTPIEKVLKDINKEINPAVGKENKDGDVILAVEGEVIESITSQTADNVPGEGGITTVSHIQVAISEQSRDEVGKSKQWEIVKSIVYGGLVESITSLGIVASAASSGATPLNIIALGFANLVGGLFILGHNLSDLKNDHSGGDQQQTTVQDKYQELLGRRENFMFHAVVAVLSFLIFGSVPLIIYGLLISKNYYDEVKLAIVAATSVACIILLATGKVYTKRPPKSYIKTVLYYVTMALGASAVSYIAGSLVKHLLEKFNHSESGLAITMPLSDSSVEPAWMSY